MTIALDPPLLPTFEFETRFARLGYRAIAGVDEAGRGPLAGPVVACAVVLRESAEIDGVRDSKLLTPAERERLVPIIFRAARGVGVGIASQAVIDRVNILGATKLAMTRALRRLRPPADFALIDGRDALARPLPTAAVVRGDQRSVSIAAESIVAKVTRDFLMARYDRLYPGYGFARHKGYPTADHRAAIRRLGPSPIHRMTFRLLD